MRGFWDIIGGIGDAIGNIGKAIGDAISHFFGGGSSENKSSSTPYVPKTPKEAIQHLNQGLKRQQKSRAQSSGSTTARPPVQKSSTPAATTPTHTSTTSSRPLSTSTRHTRRYHSRGHRSSRTSFRNLVDALTGQSTTDATETFLKSVEGEQEEVASKELPRGRYVVLPSGKFMEVSTGKILDAPPQGMSYAGQGYELVGYVGQKNYLNLGGHRPLNKTEAVRMYQHLVQNAKASPNVALEAVVKEAKDAAKASTRPSNSEKDVQGWQESKVFAQANASLVGYYYRQAERIARRGQERINKFEQEVREYQTELEKYNAAVMEFNKKASKPVPPDVAKKLEAERQKLEEWRKKLEARASDLQKEYKELNEFIESINTQVKDLLFEKAPSAAWGAGFELGRAEVLTGSKAVQEALIVERASELFETRSKQFASSLSQFGMPKDLARGISEGLIRLAIAGTWSDVFRVPELVATLRGDKKAAELHFSKGLLELEEASKNFGKDWGKYLGWYLTSPGPSIIEMYGAGLVAGAAISKVASIPRVAATASRFSKAINVGSKLLNIGIGAAVAGDIAVTAMKDVDTAVGKAAAYAALGAAFTGGASAGAKWMESRLSKSILKEPLEIKIKNAEYVPAEKKLVGELQAKIGKHELFTSPFEAKNIYVKEAITGVAKSIRTKVTSYSTKILGVRARTGVADWIGIRSRGLIAHSPYIETIRYNKPPEVPTDVFRRWLAKRIGRVGTPKAYKFSFAYAKGPRGALGLLQISPTEIQGSGDALRAILKVSRKRTFSLFEGAGVAGKGYLATVDVPTGVVGIKELARGTRADLAILGKRVFNVDTKFLEYRSAMWAGDKLLRAQAIGRSKSILMGKTAGRTLLTYSTDILDNVVEFRGVGLYKSPKWNAKVFVSGAAEISPFKPEQISPVNTAPVSAKTAANVTGIVRSGSGTTQAILSKMSVMIPKTITVPKISAKGGFTGLISATAEQAIQIIERGKSALTQALPTIPTVLNMPEAKVKMGEKGEEISFNIHPVTLAIAQTNVQKTEPLVMVRSIQLTKQRTGTLTITTQKLKTTARSLTKTATKTSSKAQSSAEIQIQKTMTKTSLATITAPKPPSLPTILTVRTPPIVMPEVQIKLPKFGFGPLNTRTQIRRRPKHRNTAGMKAKASYLWFVKPTLFAADAIKKMFGGIVKIPRSPEVTKAYVRWLKSGGYTEFNPWKIVTKEDKSSKRSGKKILSDRRKKRRRRK